MDKYFVIISMVALSAAVAASEPSESSTFTMPESCKSKGMEYCFSNDNYPTKVVEELLSDVKNFVVGSQDDVGVIYADRQGGPESEECHTMSKNDTIYYIVDESGQDRVVVQMAGRFQQWFSVYYCEEEGAMSTRTAHFLEHTVKRYKMSCKNTYAHYDFLVLSIKPDSQGKWYMEKARTKTGIPVCCVCTYQPRSRRSYNIY